ncbi:MAG: recombinase RecT [Oscillospiraceae bacterium]|nr:recombinase RecT [Oscillospiraceae bacterium]MDY5736528.1 recombinase RecT [Oscillospiraceae bacterium]
MNERAVTTTSGRKPTFSMMISTEGYQRMISSALKDEQRRNRFIASITSAVAVNPALQECTPQTILSGALLGESLNLSPSPQLGQYYLVPFKNNRQGVTEAQFCLG